MKKFNLCLNLSKKTIFKRRFLRKYTMYVQYNLFSIGHADFELDNLQKINENMDTN